MAEKEEKKAETFIQKIMYIQQKLNAPKSQYNSYGKYHYRSLEDINSAVKPLLNNKKLLLLVEDELVIIGERYYIKSIAKITDGKESVSATGYARESETKKGMDDSQLTGTASSYARKYALNALLLIDDTKDADTNQYKEQHDKAASQKIDQQHVSALEKRIAEVASLSDKTPKKLKEQIIHAKFIDEPAIKELDSEQFVTLTRYLNELEKHYKSMKK